MTTTDYSGSKYVLGEATVVFAGQNISYATKVEIQCEPTVITPPNVQKAAGPVGFLVADREIIVRCTLNKVGPDEWQWMTGWNGNTQTVGNATVVNLDQSVHTLPEGALTIIGKWVDGVPLNLRLKRTTAVPTSRTFEWGRSALVEWVLEFRMCDPGDGTNIAGTFEFGDTTV